jgi:hypothetical protein
LISGISQAGIYRNQVRICVYLRELFHDSRNENPT